jgi:hypothetical protein
VSTKLVEALGKKRRQRGSYFSRALVPSLAKLAKYAPSSSGDGGNGGGSSGGGGGGSGGGSSRSVQQQQQAAARQQPSVLLRQWTLGEVVTALAGAGLCLTSLVEEPGVKLDDAGLPKMFMLSAVKH